MMPKPYRMMWKLRIGIACGLYALLSAYSVSAGLVLNLDASDTGTLNGGAAVSLGTPISSWGQNYGKTASFPLEEAGTFFQPSYDPSGLNGLPTIRFDGINDRLVGSQGNLIGNDEWTILFVGQTLDTAQTGQNIFAQPNGFTGAGGGLSITYSSDAAGWVFRHRDGIGGASQDNMPFPGVDDDGDPNTADRSGGRGEVAIRGISGTGTSFLSYYNDLAPLETAAVSGSTMWNTAADTYVGTRSTFSRFFDGNVSQIVAFDSQLVGSDLLNVKQALSDKWNLGVSFGGDATAGNALLEEPPVTLVEATNISNNVVSDWGNFINPSNGEIVDSQLNNIGEGILLEEFAPRTGRFWETAPGANDAESNHLGFFVYQLPAIPADTTLSGAELTAFLADNSALAQDGTLNFVGVRASQSPDSLPSDFQKALNPGPRVASDFDGDGSVNFRDFLIWQRNVQATGQVDNSNGDADGNGVVDGADLVLWESQLGQTGGSGAISIETEWADPSTPAGSAALPVLNEVDNPELLTFLQDAYDLVGEGGYVFFATTLDQMDLNQDPTVQHGYRVRGGKSVTSFNPMVVQLAFQDTGSFQSVATVPEPGTVTLTLIIGVLIAGIPRQRIPRE